MNRIRWFHVGMTAICVCFRLTMQVHAQIAIHEVDFSSSDGGYTVTNVGNIQNPWTWAAEMAGRSMEMKGATVAQTIYPN